MLPKHLASYWADGHRAHSPPQCTRLQAPRGRVRPTPRPDARTRISFTMSHCRTAGPRPTRALPRSSLSTNSRSSVSVAAPGCCQRSTCEYAVEIDAGVDIVHITLSQAARVNAHGKSRSGACMVGHSCEVEWVARMARQGVARSAEHIQCSRGSVVRAERSPSPGASIMTAEGWSNSAACPQVVERPSMPPRHVERAAEGHRRFHCGNTPKLSKIASQHGVRPPQRARPPGRCGARWAGNGAKPRTVPES